MGETKDKVSCLYCTRDLTRMIRITCAECPTVSTNVPVILCIECFSVGVEDVPGAPDHRKNHAYRVSDCLSFTIMEDWTADEELLLLEGIEMFGMGNWKDIAEHVGTKSDKKCESQYVTEYLKLPPSVVPESSDSHTAEKTQDKEKENQPQSHHPEPLPPQPTAKARGAISSSSSSSSSSTSSSSNTERPLQPPNNNTSNQNSHNEEKEMNSKIMGTALAGYMPLRGDFDVEHDNDAESILADMEFHEEKDHPAERELKLKVIAIYNAKLDERERRKKFVLEHGLLDYKKYQLLERRRPKEERELIAAVRPFARFHSKDEHEAFVQGLLHAMKLRKRIAQLQEYRRCGIRTLAEAEMYEMDKKKRETELALQKQRESASYLFNDNARLAATASTSAHPSRSHRNSRWLSREGSSTHVTDIESNGNATHASRIVDGAPGAHLLTPKEKELCARLQLLPKQYLVIKDVLVRESFRLGHLDAQAATKMVHIDAAKTGHLYDFFVHAGWVQNKNQDNQSVSGQTSTAPGVTLLKKKEKPSSSEEPASEEPVSKKLKPEEEPVLPTLF